MEKLENNLNKVFERINNTADIVEVISRYNVKLEKRGKNYTGLCPFHGDKNIGNFSVSPDKKIFKCFACGEAGNSISFVQKIEHISFTEAAKKVCDICGIVEPELMNLKKAKVNPRVEKSYEILDTLNSLYTLNLYRLSEADEALKYLHNRGIDDEIISNFSIGYSSLKSDETIKYLTSSKNYSLKELDDAGVVDYKNSNLKDKNAGRITFALKDKNNKVVGFSARIIKNDPNSAKYINTSQSLVFDKSSLLYNYYNTEKEVYKTKYVYLLEGFMDVIACYRVGIKYALGLMGTALTKEHIRQIKDLKVTVRLCLDLDSPGQQAMYRIIDQFEKEGIPYELVSNDVDFSYKDSDEILSNLGKDALIKFLSTTIGKFDWIVNFYKKTHKLESIEDKKAFLKWIKPFLIKCSGIEYEDYINRISNIIGHSREAIEESLNINVEKLNYKNTIKSNIDKRKEEVSNETKINVQRKDKTSIKSNRLLNLEYRIVYELMINKERFISNTYKFKCEETEKLYQLINEYKDINSEFDLNSFLIEKVTEFPNILMNINDIRRKQKGIIDENDFIELIKEAEKIKENLSYQRVNDELSEMSNLDKLNEKALFKVKDIKSNELVRGKKAYGIQTNEEDDKGTA